MNRHKLDLETLTKEMQERIVGARRNYRFWEALAEVLGPREGQVVTKRIATALEKHPALEGYYVSYNKDYTLYTLHIWKQGEWDSRASFYIGRKHWDGTATRVNLEEIREDHCKWAVLEKGRADSLEAAMSELPRLVEEWNKACDALEGVHKEAKALAESLTYKFHIAGR